jgi:hypothetical protein
MADPTNPDPKKSQNSTSPKASWLPDFGGLLGNAQKKLKRRKLAIDDTVDAAVSGPSSSTNYRIQ